MPARRTSALPVKIYSSGLRPPEPDDKKAIHDILLLQHNYYNVLVKIDGERLASFRARRAAESPGLEENETKLAEIGERIDEVYELLRASKGHDSKLDRDALEGKLKTLKTARKKLSPVVRKEQKRLNGLLAPANKELQQRIKAWFKVNNKKPWATVADKKGRKKAVYAPSVNREARQAVLDEMLSEKEHGAWWRDSTENDRDCLAKMKEARHASGLAAGTYLLTEKAFEAAKKAAKGKRIHFAAWDGCGRVGVQLKDHRTTAEIFSGKSTFLQIELLPVTGTSKRAITKRFAIVKIRIGSDESMDPIWATFPARIHREIPEGFITWAWILVRREGLKTRYDLQLTVESDAFPKRAQGEGTMAIDLGWRTLLDGSVRVGYALSDKDEHTQLVVPEEILSRLRFANSLRGFGDVHFDKARETFAEWLSTNTPPAWMKEKRQVWRKGKELKETWLAGLVHMSKWRAHGKLAVYSHRWTKALEEGGLDIRGLWQKWRDERLKKHQDLFASFVETAKWFVKKGISDNETLMGLWLAWWQKKDAHLIQYESDSRKKAIGQRTDLYRRWARIISDTTGEVILEKWDMRDTAEKPKGALPDKRGNPTVRQLVAPSKLRTAIVEACGKWRVSSDPAKNTTRACSSCGHVDEDIDARKSILVTCPNCQAVEDQDERAARNLLAWHGSERPAGDKKKRSARTSEIPEAYDRKRKAG